MKILIVEDEVKLANALKKGLEQESFAVDAEYDSDSGIASAEALEYDLFIFDRMLPGELDGIGMVQVLRSKNIKTPVIF